MEPGAPDVVPTPTSSATALASRLRVVAFVLLVGGPVLTIIAAVLLPITDPPPLDHLWSWGEGRRPVTRSALLLVLACVGLAATAFGALVLTVSRGIGPAPQP